MRIGLLRQVIHHIRLRLIGRHAYDARAALVQRDKNAHRFMNFAAVHHAAATEQNANSRCHMHLLMCQGGLCPPYKSIPFWTRTGRRDKHRPDMEEDLISLMYLVCRYLHVVASCLLIGGTLFYELIVPVAIDDLTDPVKLSVFARARWAFRWIVWCSAAVILISGVVSSARNWYAYSTHDSMIETIKADPTLTQKGSIVGPGHWWLAHSMCGLVGVVIALILVK